ncbi:antibiotic biosynthesis monooxygenase [Streptomyces humi]|uniref:antibiotic biosynthesis monooxygenase n=1 Tax=Streptomyces humi TaxID=1428620 RepID=UPI0006286F1F|nr:antibiotic biosynthesis monooxygenase [Streptomyces humi]
MRGDTGTEDSVTVMVTRVVAPEREEEFARWAEEADRAAAGCPGHLGAVRLHDGQGLHHLVYRFDSAEHLDAWERSDVRRELVRRGNRISEPRSSRSTDLAPWFTLQERNVPPRWKSFLTTWAAAYPCLLTIATLLKLLFPALPQAAALAVNSLVLTALLTWVIQPRLTRRARSWLLRGARPAGTRGTTSEPRG